VSAAQLPADPVNAARALLGAHLTANGVEIRIVETEAYGGVGEDPASHAHRGQTARNASMFGPAGLLYIYFTYGMHHCANVVVGAPGSAGAVLLRAGEVVAGADRARSRRGPRASDWELARGPARLCLALGIDLSNDGTNLLSDAGVRLVMREPLAANLMGVGPRVGVRQAADRPWRFWIAGDPHVSQYRPAARRGEGSSS
jgi:DNA-3-methyladenine glycosylase